MTEPFQADAFLQTLTHRPGVYRMLGEDDQVLYVGKARDLKKRVASYFGSKAHHPKTQALMRQTRRVEVTVTSSEQEALLLEYNLIKTHTPRFNIVLRDDKSYPYIYLTSEQTYPRFSFHRGSRRKPGQFFGPFPNAGAVRRVLADLQKLFQVRQCQDAYFANRSRPCLQHQIKRCTAPCVGLVSADDYARDVTDAVNFLRGKDDVVVDRLVAQMEAASAQQEFEEAARRRDQIAAIRQVQATQVVAGGNTPDADVLALHTEQGTQCIALIMIRNRRVLGSRWLYPTSGGEPDPGEVMAATIAQHYFEQAAPAELVVSVAIPDSELLSAALTERSGARVEIKSSVRGQRRKWLAMAQQNAREGAAQRLAARGDLQTQFLELQRALGLNAMPERIECFDISHTGGERTVAACVAFTRDGPAKSGYRRYNIREADAGDDYAAIAEAVRRRYSRTDDKAAAWPDLVLIDGGRGQLTAATTVLDELQIGGLELLAVAKGAGRKAGREKLLRPGSRDALRLDPSSPALHLIQQLRDEAHRFAITAHRQRRGRKLRESLLEEIAGLGPKRRRALLQAFGGLRGVRRAGVDDLAKVNGISRTLAQRIHEHLHSGKT